MYLEYMRNFDFIYPSQEIVVRTKTETKIVTEYPDTYPRTPECEKYLQLRAKHEDTEGKRAAWSIVAAIGGTSGLNNAADNEAFRKTQYAYHDCQMTAMAFFSAKKGITSDVAVENESSLKKSNS
jgi:hypothetical protein